MTTKSPSLWDLLKSLWAGLLGLWGYAQKQKQDAFDEGVKAVTDKEDRNEREAKRHSQEVRENLGRLSAKRRRDKLHDDWGADD